MGKRLLTLAIAVVMVTWFLPAQGVAQKASFSAPATPKFAPGDLLVKYKVKVGGRTLGAAAIATAKVSVARKFKLKLAPAFKKGGALDRLNIQQFRLAAGEGLQQALQRLRKDPNVEIAEPNYLLYALKNPNDPEYRTNLWGMKKIRMATVWDRLTGSRRVVVAVIDTGIDYNHKDIKGNMWRNRRERAGNRKDDDRNGVVDDIFGANFCGGRVSGNPMDDNRHGTHVAGTIGAMGNNGLQVVGVNWRVRLMAVKFCVPTVPERPPTPSGPSIMPPECAPIL